jgi:glycosyltransferase involved in cell wall biosynthesis
VDIAFVSNVVYPFVKGGAQKRVHEVGTRLVDRGHDVTVYGRHYWDGPRVRTDEGMTLRAVAPARDLYTDDGRRSITEAVGFGARVLAPLAGHRGDHDVVDVSVFPYFPVFSSALATAGADVPVVATWHEVWLEYWHEYLGRLGFGGRAVERLAARTPQRAVAVSGVTADRLATIGPRRDRIDVVPNGIDVDRVQAVEPAANGVDVLFVGRLAPDKNVGLLLEAFDAVAGDHDVTLGVVGAGPREVALRSQAATMTHGDRVTFFGFLDEYEDVLAHMRAADVFVSPSTREGFGMTALEAMAAGCTTVVADHPESAASEVVGDAGVVVVPTVDAVADAIDRALSGAETDVDPVERAGRFTWESVVDDLLATYRRATTGDGG